MAVQRRLFTNGDSFLRPGKPVKSIQSSTLSYRMKVSYLQQSCRKELSRSDTQVKDLEIEIDDGLHFEVYTVRKDGASDCGRAGSKSRKKVPCIRLLGYSQPLLLRVCKQERRLGSGRSSDLTTTRVGVNDSPAELDVILLHRTCNYEFVRTSDVV